MDGWKYAKKILNNWLNSGIKTVAQVQAEELNFKANKVLKKEMKEIGENDFIDLYEN